MESSQKYYADFHIHSKYSMATSKHMELSFISRGARAKGINLVGTGDFTNPGWLYMLEKGLKETEREGIYEFEEAIYISEKKNIIVEGKGDVQLLCNNMDDNVFWIVSSRDVIVRNVRTRHTDPTEDERCYGNVFGIDSSDDIIIEDCEIDGCGAIGVYICVSDNVTLKNNHIHDNTIWAFQFDGVGFLEEVHTIAGLFLEGNLIENNGTYSDGLVLEEGFTVATFIGTEEVDYLYFLLVSQESGDTVSYLISSACENCFDVGNASISYIGTTMEIEWEEVEVYIEEIGEVLVVKRIRDIVILD